MLLCLNASLQEITCKMSLCKSNLKNFQIDPISAQVVENFMANNLKKILYIHNSGICGIFETPYFSIKCLNCSYLILVIFFYKLKRF